MRKIRKFGAGGSTEEDAQEARDKAAGLAASNAELEKGDRKPSGFLGLGRFLQGNIDQKGSEAYNLYGAGYGREIEAKNARLKAKTEADTKAPAASAPAPLTAAGNAKASADRAKAAADNLTKRGGREEDRAAPEADSTGLTKRGGREEDKAVPKVASTRGITVPKAAPKAADTAPKVAAETKAPAAETKAPAAETKAPAAETKAPAPSTTPEKGDGGGRDSSRFKKVSAAKAAPKAAPEAAKTDTSKAFGKEQQYQRAQEAAQTPEGQAKRKKIIESQAIENFSPELEVAGGLGGLGLKAAAKLLKLLKRGSGKGFFRKDPEFDYPRVRRGELPAPKKSDSANPSNLSLPKPAPRLGLPRPKGDDIADVVAKRKGGSVQGYASGGSVAASSRGDGIAQRGKTRGKMR